VKNKRFMMSFLCGIWLTHATFLIEVIWAKSAQLFYCARV
jgi:hypothetical protein